MPERPPRFIFSSSPTLLEPMSRREGRGLGGRVASPGAPNPEEFARPLKKLTNPRSQESGCVYYRPKP